MKKKIYSVLIVAMLLSMILVPSFAQVSRYINDLNGTLSAEQLDSLEQRSEKVSYTYDIDTAVFFIDDFGDLEPGEYCDRLWSQYGFSDDCVMFVVATQERAYYYYACGSGSIVQTDYGSQYIDEKVLPYLKSGNYYKAAGEFVTFSAEFANHYSQTGSAYDVNDKPDELKMLLIRIFGNTGIGLLLAGVPLIKQKKSMKTVTPKVNASEYIQSKGLMITAKNDMHVNHHVSRVPIPKADPPSGNQIGSHSGGTTMHTGSSGHSYSGHGGHF